MGGSAPSLPIDASLVTGLVLAGGRATRMGGQDKGLVPFHGEPLALRAARRLAPQVASVAINANRHAAAYAAWGMPVWADASDDRPGPLAGVLAGLQRCPTPWLATVPCDSPLFPDDLVVRLAAAMAADPACEIAAAATGSPEAPRLEPVFCLLHRSLAGDLQAFIAGGERKVERWLRGRRLAVVRFADPGAFANVNTADELRELAARAS